MLLMWTISCSMITVLTTDMLPSGCNGECVISVFQQSATVHLTVNSPLIVLYNDYVCNVLQLINNNDQLTEKFKAATAECKEQETRADDFERELKSLQNKYEALEGIRQNSIFLFVIAACSILQVTQMQLRKSMKMPNKNWTQPWLSLEIFNRLAICDVSFSSISVHVVSNLEFISIVSINLTCG